MSDAIHHQVVIVGGGTAGISVAARLTKGWFHRRDVAVVEPSDKHYYQPSNLLAAMQGRPLATKYVGYTSCPLFAGFLPIMYWHGMLKERM